MSLRSVARNPQKRIGRGIDRTAYYSKRHKVVIKKCHDWGSREQSLHEIELFKQMTEEEKEVFPIVGYYMFDNYPVVIMKKCIPLEDMMDCSNYDFDNWADVCEVADQIGATYESIKSFIAFVDKYNICDLHDGNIGFNPKNKSLVLIDAGFNRDDASSEEYYESSYSSRCQES